MIRGSCLCGGIAFEPTKQIEFRNCHCSEFPKLPEILAPKLGEHSKDILRQYQGTTQPSTYASLRAAKTIIIKDDD